MNKSERDALIRTRLFSKEFEERDDIVLWDVLNISHEQTIKVNIISTNSKFIQGIRLAIDTGKGSKEK